MVSNNGHDKSKRTAKAAISSPSPADKFDIDRDEPATHAGRLRAQQQRFQRLHEYCDEALGEIRASLERAPPGQRERRGYSPE